MQRDIWPTGKIHKEAQIQCSTAGSPIICILTMLCSRWLLHTHPSLYLSNMRTHTHTHREKDTNRNQNPPLPPSFFSYPHCAGKWKLGTRRGWVEEMKTCLISTATNSDAALCTPCPLIGLFSLAFFFFNSLHLEAQINPSNPAPKHGQANPETRLRSRGGMKELRHGRNERCCSGGEKGAAEARCARRSQCVIINKALEKWAHQSTRGPCYHTWKYRTMA